MTTPKEEQKHTDLLPCPGCGFGHAMMNDDSMADYGSISHGVICGNPDCPWEVNCQFVSKDFAIAAWNTRAPTTRKADCHEELPCPVEMKPCPYINGFSADNIDVSFMLKNYDDYSDFVVFTDGKPDRCFRFARATNHQESGEK